MTGSLILFTLFIIFYIIISDIITVLFRLTGLTEEKARFQVVSLLTNSGFTTRESEAVASSKLRRRIAKGTMVFGYAFTVTIVATAVNFFTTLDREKLYMLLILIPVLAAFLILFYFLRKSVFLKTKFDRLIEKLGNKIMFGDRSNPILLVEEYGETVAAHVYIHKVPSFLENVPLSESPLMAEHNIMVMMVKKKDGKACQANAGTVLKKHDIIMVLGKRKDIREVFEKV